MNIRYRVDLSETEREELAAMLNVGKHAAPKLKRARILMAANAGIGDEVIARTLSVSGSTIYRTKRRFVEGNLALALSMARCARSTVDKIGSPSPRVAASVFIGAAGASANSRSRSGPFWNPVIFRCTSSHRSSI